METLVALSLVGLALLWTLWLVFEEPRALRRLEAHGEALRALEATLEAVRAGRRVPPGGEEIEVPALDPPRVSAAADLRVWIEREASSPAGLYRLTLTARYRVGGQPYERRVETMLWAPR